MSPMNSIVLSLCVSATLTGAVPELLIDDDDSLHAWHHKPNVTLSRHGGALVARMGFGEFRYAWFRKGYQKHPLDLTAFEGLTFRSKGAIECDLLVHLMTGTAGRLTTYVTARPIRLRGDDWRTHHISWLEMCHEAGRSPLPVHALREVAEINFSIVARGQAKTSFLLADLRAAKLPATVHEAIQARLRFRRPIADEAAFFALLALDQRADLQAVRDALPNTDLAKVELLRHMRTRKNPAYFFAPESVGKLAKAIRLQHKDYPAAVVRAADRLMTHQYTWEGETRTLKRPIDYRQNGKEWSAVLNRSYFLTNISRAWWFTGQERYAEEVIGQMCEWAKSCPVPLHGKAGRTWQPLEVGCRAHSWLRLYMAVLMSESMTPEANYTILKSLAEHANVLSDPGLEGGLPNMIIMESSGLATLAMLLPEFRGSEAWLKRGLEVLDTELRRRVLPDGAWEEATPGYHSGVAHSCLGFSVLAQRNDIALPVGFEARFRSMYDWLLKITKPNGHMPMLGDASDSPIRNLMTEAALLFDDPMFKHFSRKELSAGNLELFGLDALQTYAQMQAKPPTYGSLHLQASGLIVMRTGYRPSDSYLLFDVGPIWSHTHQDTLGFSLHAKGQTVLWDSGVSNYNLPECRAYYHQARAHNIVLVDDLDLRLNGRPVVHGWHSEEAYDLADAEAVFANPGITHRRQILFLKPNCWILRDVLRADAPHRYERLFHVREKSAIKVLGDTATVAEKNGPTLRITGIRPRATAIEVKEALLTYHHGRGPGNNNLEAPVVSLGNQAPAGGVDLVTILTIAAPGEPQPPVTGSLSGEDLTVSVTVNGTTFQVVLPGLDGDHVPPPKYLGAAK
ncbi:MAG: alginate lyase family protein [Lentisphaeria bacterium]|nr:alginate lyase family protein [Lentisphaeria bacterium]